MKRKKVSFPALCLLVLLLAQPVRAQAEGGLELKLNRDFGYGGFGQIQGLFTMVVRGPEDLERVVFAIDGQVIGQDAEPPFRLQFSTDSYPAGVRALSAIGFTTAGGELRSNVITVEFISRDAVGSAVGKIVLPLLGLAVFIFGALAAATIFAARRRGPVPLGQPRKYGLAGGAICARCSRPFPLSFLSFRLGAGRLVPCPHCGKWAFVRSRPLAELRAAEAAERARAQGAADVAEPDAEEKLRRVLDESRYQDM
jgi:DNA-directed RNA polymerase subunit RPC12/RpoP